MVIYILLGIVTMIVGFYYGRNGIEELGDDIVRSFDNLTAVESVIWYTGVLVIVGAGIIVAWPIAILLAVYLAIRS